jgi:hypothetical protein
MTQLYAKIKKTSRYAKQAAYALDKGKYPFKVRVNPNDADYMYEGGPGGRYRKQDLTLYVEHGGKMVRL